MNTSDDDMRKSIDDMVQNAVLVVPQNSTEILPDMTTIELRCECGKSMYIHQPHEWSVQYDLRYTCSNCNHSNTFVGMEMCK